ncbi:MAG: hypothetical protein AB1598_01220 [Thermodesulfobacteriota bacterium]
MKNSATGIKKGLQFVKIPAITLHIVLFWFLSGGCSPGPDDPREDLIAYCVRECVIETSDSEICDTRCKCAVKNLEEETTAQELRKIASGITKNDDTTNEFVVKFRDAFKKCTSFE